MDSLQNRENPNRNHHFSNHTMVYIDLKATGLGIDREIYQIGAHFAGNSFSRYVCPNGTFGEETANQTELSMKIAMFHLRGERFETVSKMDAWKDFLKFLESANNSLVLVTHHKLNSCYLLFRDLSELSLMVKFRKICAGVIDTLPLCTRVFPGRYELGKNYKLKELVKDKLGEENPSFSATVNAINLEKLMKHANVQSEMFQQDFIALSTLECQYEIKMAKTAAKARMNFNGEGSSASLLPSRVKARKHRANRKKTSPVTLDVNKPVAAKKMTTMDSPQNDENPNGSHNFPDHTMVYFELNETGLRTGREVCQIGAHFAESSFSRYVCPTSTFTPMAAKRTGLSKKDGILYLEGERVETVSKMDAWKDFLKFLQSANKSVVLVTHNIHHCFILLFRDLSVLSLMEEFRKVCLGVIDTHSLCQNIFPERNEFGKIHKLEVLVQDKLGEENSSGHHNATVDAINLEKLMKYAKVEPEMFLQHFFSLANLEYRCKLSRKKLRRKEAKKAAKARMTFNDNHQISSVENGEGSDASLLSDMMRARNLEANRKETSAFTLDVSRQGKKMTAKDSLQNSENPKGSHHFSDHTMVYFNLKGTCPGGEYSEVCQIGAHFAENSFSRYVCPIRNFTKVASKLTGFSKKYGFLYLRGKQVETVSNMDAWKDFLKFLQSANNSVVLVMHDRHNDCSLLLRDLSNLSLIEEFRKVCAGVIDTVRLCRQIFPGRNKIGKNHRLEDTMQNRLGEKTSAGSHNALDDAINLEKLVKHAFVQPEVSQQYFFSLSDVEYFYQIRKEAILLKNKFSFMGLGKAKRMVRAGITYNDLERSYIDGGEDGIASFLSYKDIRKFGPKAIGETTIAITNVLRESGVRRHLDNPQP
ncbi:uncharacterized protein [Anabrus simplex]|uniref:uncharacterized protein n=1 Tax=Anabrus simplex TaxID=316456 RepID=UPI0035A26B47